MSHTITGDLSIIVPRRISSIAKSPRPCILLFLARTCGMVYQTFFSFVGTFENIILAHYLQEFEFPGEALAKDRQVGI